MSVMPIEHREARDALVAASERTAELVSSIDDVARPIPGMEWTVGNAATHLAAFCLPAFTDAARGDAGRWERYVPHVEGFHRRMASANARTLDDAPPLGGEDLGRMIREGTSALLEAVDARQDHEGLPTPWYGDGATLDRTSVSCLMLGELVVHGYDIARGLGRRWPIDPGHARLVVGGVFPSMIPRILDRRAARGVAATYEIRVWGGVRFVNHIGGGTAVAEPCAGQSVDCHLSGHPVELMLVGYGRKSQWGPIAMGRLLAWGRKPWLGLRWKSMYEDP
jgi:uncharacterized protein (TIGR03083 family)